MDTLGLAFRLARRELRGGLRGLRVFWLCLMLGVAVIAAVGSVSEAVARGLGADARSLLGGDLEVRINQREATPEQLALMRQAGAVSRVTELRTMVRTEGNTARRLAELKAVDARYPLYGAVELDPPQPLDAALARTDAGWGVVMDQSLMDLLGVHVGEPVHIGESTFAVRAQLTREPDRTGRSILFGATVIVADASLPATRLVLPGSLVTYRYRIALPPDADAGAWETRLHDAFPEAGWRTRTYENASPSVGRFVENLADFLQLVGLTALLVGGVGVSNAVGAYLKQKARTIATMKCLGASRTLVFQTYLLQTMLLAATGVGVGLALGAAAPFVAVRVLGDALPVPVAVSVYPAPLLLAAAYGMLTAFVFSLWPLAGVREVPAAGIFRSVVAQVRKLPPLRYIVVAAAGVLALAALAVWSSKERDDAFWFVAGSLGTLALFYATGRLAIVAARAVGRPRRADLRLALANLYRPGAPTGNVVLSLGLGLTVLVTIALVEGVMTQQIAHALPQEAPNFFFLDIQPDQLDAFESLVQEVPGDVEFQRVPMLRARIVEIAGVPVEQAHVGEGSRWAVEGDRQITWAATPPGTSEVVAGTWWPKDYDGPPIISLEEDIAQDFGVTVGDTLGFNILGRQVETTIANIRHVDWESMGINFAVVFAPGFLENVPHSDVATVRMAPEYDTWLERQVTDRFPNVSAIRLKDFIGTATRLLQQIGMAVRVVAAVAILSGVLVLGGAVATEHHRRVYDAVVLKVLGATRGDVVRAYGIEYGLLGLMTAGIAALIGSGVAFAVIHWVMHLDWIFLPQTLVLTAAAAMALTVAAGLVGTWLALGQPASHTLRNE